MLESLLGSGGMGVVFAARDPVLDRKVAIKLIHPGKGSSGGIEARLLREAQALARLTHPNVVTVHEAGVVGGTVFLAMELVDGVTLRDWMATARPWRDIVGVFVAAGTGLAAAHAAGMIHRDFKPANVLIDRAGRVKVGDFGLVGVARDLDGSVAAETPVPPSVGSVLASPLTQDGAVMGTPAYMAPEQLLAGNVDARADQYAFCKSLGEALATATDAVPPGLTAIVVRGQLDDADARFPTMAAVLAAIDGVVRGRRRRIVGAAIGGGVVAAAAVAVIATWGVVGGGGDPCSGADPLAGRWNSARRESVRAHLVSVDPTGGAARLATVDAALDAESGRLRTMRKDACHANRVKHTESDTLYDRRIECLDHRGTELTTAIDALLATKDASGVDTATAATQNLSADACVDGNALLAQVPPPADPAQRQEVDAITAELAKVAKARVVGDLSGQAANTLALVGRARATHYDPVLAAALRARAEILEETANHEGESDVLRELTEVAARAHEDGTAAWAWTQLLVTIISVDKKPDDAMLLVPAARAAVLRAGATPDIQVDFLYTLAAVLGYLDKMTEAHAQLDEAVNILKQQGAEQPGSTKMHRLADCTYESATLYGMAGDAATAEPLYRHSVELYSQSLGADHSDTAWGWHGLGEALRSEGKADEAITAYREAVRIRLARTGESEALAETLVSLAAALVDAGKPDTAIPELDHAITIYRARGSDTHLAIATMTLGRVYRGLGDDAAERKAYDDALAVFEKFSGQDNNYPITLANRGDLFARQGDIAAAEADYAKALELFTKYLGAEHPRLMIPYVGLAECALARGKRADTVHFADKALALKPPGTEGNVLELARFFRAMAQGDRSAAKASREKLEALGLSAKEQLDIADKWLKKH